MSEKKDKKRSLDSGGGKDPVLPLLETCHSDKGGEKIFEFDSQALTQLAVGSAIFIATILALTDVLPLLPNATSATSLLLRVIGDWIVVLIIWFLGFLAITQTLRLISRGVLCTTQGIKLSRLDRTIPWTAIEAVILESNPFFSRLFSLPYEAKRLTLLFHFEVKNRFFAQLLFPNYIASFFFKRETFAALCEEIFSRTGLLDADRLAQPIPDGYGLLVARENNFAHVRSSYNWLKKQQVLVSILVVIGLFNFLGRKAVGYYCFNCGGKAFAQGRFEAARDYYRWSLKWDPTFAVGWNGLGQAEFRLAESNSNSNGADFAAAERDWRRAILFKPDYVEPRLNIARLCIYRRDFEEAGRLVQGALPLAPLNDLALIERAELHLRAGRLSAARKDAQLVLSQCNVLGHQNKEYSFKARCLLAQARLLNGEPAAAFDEIKRYANDVSLYHDGEDFTSLLVLRAKIFLAQGNLEQAQSDIETALQRHPFNEEVLTTAMRIFLARDNEREALFLLQRAKRSGISDPWLDIVEALNFERHGERQQALAAFGRACARPVSNQDYEALTFLLNKLAAYGADGDSLLPSARARMASLALK